MQWYLTYWVTGRAVGLCRARLLAAKLQGFFAIPAVGTGVWIEFEHGCPECPIWAGCWWGSKAEMPLVLLEEHTEKKMMLKTEGGNSILLDDTPGKQGITLETSGGQKIVINSEGIEITNGKGASIKMKGLNVSINDGALEVD